MNAFEVVVPPTIGAPRLPYSNVVVSDGWVFVSGQIPKHPSSPRHPDVVSDDFVEQARQVFANLEECLVAAGASMTSIVKLHCYITDWANFGALNELMRELFTEPYPARTTVGAELHGFKIEVDCVARLA